MCWCRLSFDQMWLWSSTFLCFSRWWWCRWWCLSLPLYRWRCPFLSYRIWGWPSTIYIYIYIARVVKVEVTVPIFLACFIQTWRWPCLSLLYGWWSPSLIWPSISRSYMTKVVGSISNSSKVEMAIPISLNVEGIMHISIVHSQGGESQFYHGRP